MKIPNMKWRGLSSLFLIWMTLILAAFFVVQKPDILQIPAGLANLALTILVPLWMMILAGAFGSLMLSSADSVERITFSIALGLGAFGLAGFGLAMLRLTNPFVLLAILILLTVFFSWNGNIRRVWNDARQLYKEIADSAVELPAWIPISAIIGLTLTFLLGLAPPIEDFDALFYHLAVPAIWIRQGAATALVPLPHYWYPQIVEGIYLWPMALGSDSAPHLIHLAWLILSMILLWHWARQVAGNRVAWNSILLLLTMPSLPWLAAWAYTDYALTFAGLAALYSLWKWKTNQNQRWLVMGGLMAGLAVSVKYTGFIVPVTGVILILIWERRVQKTFLFGMICTLAASPWYLRNWIGTGNPIYPFIFGGTHWDPFLAQAYAAAGTGTGWNPIGLLTLPLIATLGINDANFFDGRIGPFFLILSPLALLAFWNARRASAGQKTALRTIGIFSAVGISLWILGVVNSAHLFQTRLLFPILLPLTIPLALGMEALPRIDLPKLKVSFIVRVMLFFVVTINLINLGLQVTARNPLAAGLGITSRAEYISRRQPGYASALALVEKTSEDARIYFLFEPRSYGMMAQVQPDSINANFAHDVWLRKSPEAIVSALKSQGFTHVLISNAGADFIFQNESASPAEKNAFEQLKELLLPLEMSADGKYILYQIP